MSRSPVRTDKTCLNCHHVVQERFCPNCGQENIETRKTFHHLFIHFFEDLTHYENAFWKTIRNLLLRPGALTKVYLSGKRMSYLAPVRLYIFISFVTFFIVAMLPEEKRDDVVKVKNDGKGWTFNSGTEEEKRQRDSITKAVQKSIKGFGGETEERDIFGYKSLRELDSIQKFGKPEDKLTDTEYGYLRKVFELMENNTRKQLKEKFFEALWHNFPKALFIYMPIFAFILWLFQSKRRWYYFDHGIFTLHYFSFLLLIYLIAELVNCVLGLTDFWLLDVLSNLIALVLFVYAFYYFFPAHHRFYEETRTMTVVKGGCIFVINMILSGILMLFLLVYTFLNLH